MYIRPGNAQHIGSRSSQQDAFGFGDLEREKEVQEIGLIAVLADGMGGHAFGDEASKLAVKTCLDRYAELARNTTIDEALDKLVELADNSVSGFAVNQGESGNVGTTLSMLVIHSSELYWRSVGDSRLYLWRDPYLCQITRDHVYAFELDEEARLGVISTESAFNHPQRDAVTSFIGQAPPQLVDKNRRPFRLLAGDQLLLCSDGLFKSLPEPGIVACLRQSISPQEVAEALVQMALAQNLTYQDNVTVMILECDAGQATKSTHARKQTLFSRLCKRFRRKGQRKS